MASPETTVRIEPDGIDLPDGFSAKIAFAADPDISIWEKTVTPPGLDGGDSIDTTTMHNSIWRTKRARSLVTGTDAQVTCGYDPDCYDEILAILNVEGSITVAFPDGSTYDFFGYLQKFEPSALQEGTYPEATLTIVQTDYDPVNHVEAGPIMTEVPGT
jgi:hypothetical protein